MLTPEELLSLVTEIRALEKLEASITHHGAADEWQYGLAAIRARLAVCRDCRSRAEWLDVNTDELLRAAGRGCPAARPPSESVTLGDQLTPARTIH